MTKLPLKKNQSSLQVLKTFKMLLQGNYSMQELIKKLNNEENEPVFNNSVVSKYINTCRACGIDIPKIHNKYFVASVPFGLELTGTDINLLERLQNIVKNDMASRYNKIFNSFIEKLNRYSNKSIARVDKETYQISAEMFEHAISEKRKIRLIFKNKTNLDCIPLKNIQNNGRTFFHVLCATRDRMIDAERVAGIEILSEKYINNFSEQVAVFKLKGALAQRYSLHENERILKEFDGESITISNRGEGKEFLLSRLMRYDDKCEILNPKAYREEMTQIINSALNNYGKV